MDAVVAAPGEVSSLAEGTGGTSPLSLRRRAFFFGVVDACLTGVEEADDVGESTIVVIVLCEGGRGDLGIAFEKGELVSLLVSLRTFSRKTKLLPFWSDVKPFCGCSPGAVSCITIRSSPDVHIGFTTGRFR